jgi:hypothetical protein
MLTNDQITCLWENRLAAETRALYFGDLASLYTRRKQWLTGIAFVLSSGAAATIVAQLPLWVPTVLALITALITAYMLAVNLDGQIATLGKLHTEWTVLATQYAHLWNHAYEPDAEDEFERLVERELDPSALGLSAPFDESRLLHWQTRVLEMYHVGTPA